MSIGKMRDRVKILQVVQTKDGSFEWQTCALAWACRQRLKEQNVFSRNAVSAPSYSLIIRKSDITLSNAVALGDVFYLLTDISPDKTGFLKLTAAQVRPTLCRKIEQKQTLSENNTPIVGKEVSYSFPACIAEKYSRFEQPLPMSTSDIARIMVTPKCVVLEAGDLIEIGSDRFSVTIVHSLADHQNEYEICRKEDN